VIRSCSRVPREGILQNTAPDHGSFHATWSFGAIRTSNFYFKRARHQTSNPSGGRDPAVASGPVPFSKAEDLFLLLSESDLA
jgi:hypothetical protein